MSIFTQSQLDALTEAIAQGVLTVEHNGKRVTYASISQMLQLRDRMMREIENQGDGVPRPLALGSVFLKR
jgi:hypothetical protein